MRNITIRTENENLLSKLFEENAREKNFVKKITKSDYKILPEVYVNYLQWASQSLTTKTRLKYRLADFCCLQKFQT